MRFTFNTFNHCRQGQIIVEDITRILGAQMAELGHEVFFDNGSFAPPDQGVNVVLESFADDPATLDRMTRAHANGCRFLIVATEEPTDNGFNHGLEPAMIDRQNAFPAAAALSVGILHLVPGQHVTQWYAQHAPAAYAELGYAESMVKSPDDFRPTIDFGFYGKMTWRREQMLSRLEAKGATLVKIDSLDVPRAERDRQMRRARVILQIRANQEWGMVSSTRCATALFFGRPVLAEPHPYSKPWDEVVRFSASVGDFYEDALRLARGNWKVEHARQLERFKTTLPAEACVGKALKEIGLC